MYRNKVIDRFLKGLAIEVVTTKFLQSVDNITKEAYRYWTFKDNPPESSLGIWGVFYLQVGKLLPEDYLKYGQRKFEERNSLPENGSSNIAQQSI